VGAASEKIGETISTLIESEIQACVETHINPLKEIVHKQEKTIENLIEFPTRSLFCRVILVQHRVRLLLVTDL
jgi:demethoxyubiquinone hydroxylase (CLK1/Coq7/Cat5 family)